MRITIVEDDANKSRRLSAAIRVAYKDAVVDQHRSYQSGLKAILDASPDLVVLDMSMPTYDVSALDKGGRMKPFAGRDLLRELKRRHVVIPVVVVTQFESFGQGSEMKTLDQLREELTVEFEQTFRGAIFYQPAESAWAKQLVDAIAGVV